MLNLPLLIKHKDAKSSKCPTSKTANNPKSKVIPQKFAMIPISKLTNLKSNNKFITRNLKQLASLKSKVIPQNLPWFLPISKLFPSILHPSD